MKERLIIIGAGGHGKVCADIAEKMGVWKKIAFLDDDTSVKESLGFPVIGSCSDMHIFVKEAELFVAVGNNAVREELQNKIKNAGGNLATLCHPNADTGLGVRIGEGTVVMAGAVINSESQIGKGCIVNTGSSVDHNCVLEDYVHLSPGVHLAGEVKIGKGSWLGIGSIVSNQVNICAGCRTGAGSVVINDIKDKGTYVGVPVRLLK